MIMVFLIIVFCDNGMNHIADQVGNYFADLHLGFDSDYMGFQTSSDFCMPLGYSFEDSSFDLVEVVGVGGICSHS